MFPRTWSRKPKENPEPASVATTGSPVPPPDGTSRELSLLSLLELSNELNALLDIYEMSDVALFNLMGHFGCSRGAFWILPDDATRDAVLVRSHGIPERVARGVGAVWTRWLMDRPGGLIEPVLVSHLQKIDSVPGLDLAEQNDIALFAPVSARRKTLGYLALGRRVGGGEFGLLDREVLSASLNLFGVGLENTNLYNRTVENNRHLRRANDKLQELDRLKSEFLQNLNHELRTPLTVIIAYLESLLSTEPEKDHRQEHLAIIHDQTTKLQGMVLNLLDYSKLMEKRFEIRTERGDVEAVLSAYYEERRPGITADLREFRFSAATDVPPGHFERERLLQIIERLVDNAAKFCPQGSLIHLRVEPESTNGQEWVRVDVEDNGPGIPPDRLAHVFDSFRQGDGSDTREHGGMGLGLAFSRRLANAMGGELVVSSDIGKGTVFTLRLPSG